MAQCKNTKTKYKELNKMKMKTDTKIEQFVLEKKILQKNGFL